MTNHSPISNSGSTTTYELSNLISELTDQLLNNPELTDSEILNRYAEFDEDLKQLLPTLREIASLPTSTADRPTLSAETPAIESQQLGDFRILGEIGRGGMGVVYEAEQLSVGRHVALKVLPFAALLDKKQISRFQNEARAAATLEHPHVVPIYSVGNERGVYYYAMRLIEGQNLAEVIAALRESSKDTDGIDGLSGAVTSSSQARKSTLAPPSGNGHDTSNNLADAQVPTKVLDETTPDVLREQQSSVVTDHITRRRVYYESIARLGSQVAEALDFAHASGVIHRDIKPANILLDTVGKAWVADFGLARLEAENSMTMTGDVVGTLRYMSPEQTLAVQPVDHRTDVYSLGATLYELLTLKPLFGGDDRAELLRQIATQNSYAANQDCDGCAA